MLLTQINCINKVKVKKNIHIFLCLEHLYGLLKYCGNTYLPKKISITKKFNVYQNMFSANPNVNKKLTR